MNCSNKLSVLAVGCSCQFLKRGIAVNSFLYSLLCFQNALQLLNLTSLRARLSLRHSGRCHQNNLESLKDL